MKRQAVTILFLAVLLSGCSHYYYVANVQNVPLFREKNEFRISGSYAAGDESESAEVQTAYSVSDNIGIMANYMSTRGGVISDLNYAKGSYIDAGVGYYKPIGKYGVFEVYGGIGRSTQRHEYSDFRYDSYTGTYHTVYDGKANLSFTKLFIQPSFGVTLNFLDVAVSGRFCRLSYTNIDYNSSVNTDLYGDINTLSDKRHLFFEPSVTLRAGWKYFKVQCQASYAKYLNSPRLYFGEEAHISVGLYVSIAERYKQ